MSTSFCEENPDILPPALHEVLSLKVVEEARKCLTDVLEIFIS
jgi:hypothetical protein